METGCESIHKHLQRYVDADRFWEMVSTCAYFKAEKRGFVEGYELQDWLEAEREISKQCSYWFQ